MSTIKTMTFEDEYYDWLEKNCKCVCVDDDCECMDFEDWLSDKLDAQAYNYDNERLA